MNKKYTACISLAVIMHLLILDAPTVIEGAKDGVALCIETVVPSLFPYIFISGLLTDSAVGIQLPLFRPLGKLTGIPAGSESLLLIGLIGGYPVGASSICAAYKSGAVSKQDAERMLGFCNNAGPAFIFGISAGLNGWNHLPWILWLIQMFSSLVTGVLLPGKSVHACRIGSQKTPLPLKSAINAITQICGWIVIFRILIAILVRWVFWILPVEVATLLIGILELTNGCVSLSSLHDPALRFIMMTFFLSFGGVCVAMQTATVTHGLSNRFYYIGKLIQSTISLSLSFICSQILFPGNKANLWIMLWVIPITIAVILICKNYTGNYRTNHI